MNSSQRRAVYRGLIGGALAWWFAVLLMLVHGLLQDHGIRVGVALPYFSLGVPPLGLGLYLRHNHVRRRRRRNRSQPTSGAITPSESEVGR